MTKVKAPPERPKPQASYLKQGDMVYDQLTGAVGLLAQLGMRHSLIQLGAMGPVEKWGTRFLRQATPEEVQAASLDGVGCNGYRGAMP